MSNLSTYIQKTILIQFFIVKVKVLMSNYTHCNQLSFDINSNLTEVVTI